MPRKLFRKHLPSHESLMSNRWLQRLKPWLGHHNLWHLHRRSVAGAVAIGLFSGLVPGPLQMLTALILAIPLRRNLPVAVLTTFYTNPFTIVPIYIVAYKIGAWVSGRGGNALPQFEFDWQGNWLNALPAFMDWVAALGLPLILGLVLLACLLTPASYFLVRGLWRLHVLWSWGKRRQRLTH
jgi:uncharacterized protein (DUF2062 family)